MLDILEIYILTLALTLGMFLILIFRVWIEIKNFKLMCQQMDWRRLNELLDAFLRLRRNFSKMEGGDELYRLLCEIFKIRES